jgi:glc operon protein GlcG
LADPSSWSSLRNKSGSQSALDGKIIGTIGVSGATSVQDGQVAKAGVEAAKGS